VFLDSLRLFAERVEILLQAGDTLLARDKVPPKGMAAPFVVASAVAHVSAVIVTATGALAPQRIAAAAGKGGRGRLVPMLMPATLSLLGVVSPLVAASTSFLILVFVHR
jgi:hypothetical protein